jgi:ATP-dependent Clp protease protease subunit
MSKMSKKPTDAPINEDDDDDEDKTVIKINPLDYIVYIVGEITMQTAVAATHQMVALDKINCMTNSFHPITMVVNSGGGSVNAAWQICDIMDYIVTPVHTTGLGQIASASLMIFMNGEPGNRLITEKTSIMSHLYSWGAAGSHNNLISVNKEFKSTYDRMMAHYINCTGLNQKKIEKELLCEHDTWLTAQEAVKFNIADEIIKTKKKVFKKGK